MKNIAVTSTVSDILHAAKQANENSIYSKITTMHIYFALSQIPESRRILQRCKLPTLESLEDGCHFFYETSSSVEHRKYTIDELNEALETLDQSTSDTTKFLEQSDLTVSTIDATELLKRAAQIHFKTAQPAISSLELIYAFFSGFKTSWFFNYLIKTETAYTEAFKRLTSDATIKQYIENEQKQPQQFLALEIISENDANTTDSNDEHEALEIPPVLIPASVLKETLPSSHTLLYREDEFQQLLQSLSKKVCPHSIVLGEAGSGKTAFLAKIATFVEAYDSKAFCVDLVALVTGLRFRTELVHRIRALFQTLTDTEEDAVVIFDDIENFVTAYENSDFVQDLFYGLAEVRKQTQIPCILALSRTTFSTLKQNYAELAEFNTIVLKPLDRTQVLEILNSQKHDFEEFHCRRFPKTTLETIIELCWSHFPKAEILKHVFEVIDLAGAIDSVNTSNQSSLTASKPLRLSSVYEAVSRKSGIPVDRLSKSETKKLKFLAQNLKKTVFGQDQALQTISNSILRAKAGLAHESKPIGSFLLSGPTGVGKTETAKQLANQLDIQLIRLDMSEFAEPHSVSRLIGSPPGYVGYRQEGLLFQKLKDSPAAVILFDEIEKAHESVHQLLLQVLDYGKLSSSAGTEISFHECIIIMTSNAGVNRTSKKAIGFSTSEVSTFSMQKLQHQFSAELRNRIDAILEFRSLEEKQILQIVDKLELQLSKKLKTKNVELCLTPTAKKYLAKNGYQPEYGARPLERLFQTELSDKLAAELLYGKLKNGGKVTVESTDLKSLCFQI